MLLFVVIAVIAIVWIICGVVNYGFTFAYFQRKYPTLAENDYKRDRNMARWFALGGIPGLIGSWIAARGEYSKYGFKWR